jgi:hypothetical protein
MDFFTKPRIKITENCKKHVKNLENIRIEKTIRICYNKNITF